MTPFIPVRQARAAAEVAAWGQVRPWAAGILRILAYTAAVRYGWAWLMLPAPRPLTMGLALAMVAVAYLLPKVVEWAVALLTGPLGAYTDKRAEYLRKRLADTRMAQRVTALFACYPFVRPDGGLCFGADDATEAGRIRAWWFKTYRRVATEADVFIRPVIGECNHETECK